jgi:superfamily II DNA or RNA helicase
MSRIAHELGLFEFEVGLEMAGMKCNHSDKMVFATIQTIQNPERLAGWVPDVIFIDEAHHAASRSYLTVIAKYARDTGAILIGCTATLYRMDKAALAKFDVDGNPNLLADDSEAVFNRHVAHYDIEDAIADGWLVEPVGIRVDTNATLAGIKKRRGDFTDKELADRIDTPERNNTVVNAYIKHAAGRTAVAFCAGIDHARHLADVFVAAGIRAAAVWGDMDTDTRCRVLDQLRSGAIDVVTNDKLISEGVDIPHIDCILCCRPTKSWGFYVQCIGRGLRPLPGVVDGHHTPDDRKRAIGRSQKQNCVIIDMADVTTEHSLCSLPAIQGLPVNFDLQGRTCSEAKAAIKQALESGIMKDDMPTNYQDVDLVVHYADIVNTHMGNGTGWRPLGNGIRFTGRNGYTSTLENVGERWRLVIKRGSHVILDKLSKPNEPLELVTKYARMRTEQHAHTCETTAFKGQATEKQIAFLRRRGYPNAETFTKRAASEAISRIIGG